MRKTQMTLLQKRIKFCIKLIQEVKSIVKEQNNEQIENALNSLNHYLENNFQDFDEKEQEQLSILMLNDAVSLSHDILEEITRKELDNEYKLMTEEEVKNKLYEEYLTTLKMGSEQMVSLSLNDWLYKNGIKIIEQSSSSN